MSAIGNFDIAQPSSAMLQAYGALFAWKLSLHGVDASSTKQWVGSKDFQAINGHRDAASTACPGTLPLRQDPADPDARRRRRSAAGPGASSSPTSPRPPHPDLVVRRASDGQGFIIPTGGLTGLRHPASAALTGLDASADGGRRRPDLTGDGIGDLLVQRRRTATAAVRPGNGAGTFGAADQRRPAARRPRPDHRRRRPQRRRPQRPGGARDTRPAGSTSTSAAATAGFGVTQLGTGWGGYNAAGRRRRRRTATATPTCWPATTSGRLWLHPGHRATAASARRVAAARRRGAATPRSPACGDFTGDGRADLFVRSAESRLRLRAPGARRRRPSATRSARSPGSSAGRRLLGAISVTRRRHPRPRGPTPASGSRCSPNTGHLRDRAAPIATGVDLAGANLVLNAGDWDRDGSRRPHHPQTRTGALALRSAATAPGSFASPTKLGTGLRRRSACSPRSAT